MHQDPTEFLNPGPTIDSEHPTVADFVSRNVHAGTDRLDAVAQLFRAVRDEIWYDPYRIDLSIEGLRASATIHKRYGWCVSKAVLLAACCRAIGVPARVGFADVQNHLSTGRLRSLMTTDVFYWHGYASIFANGRWIKASPAFNVELCAKFDVPTLEFDGMHDALHQAFNAHGDRHMEYLRDRGEYFDVPIDAIRDTFATQYPGYDQLARGGEFRTDIEHERASMNRDDD